MTWLRSMAPRDLRALLALIASFLGAVVLTGFAMWLVWILWRGGWPVDTATARIDKIGLALILTIVIMGITLIGFGLAINRRSVKGSAFGASFEATGGDEEARAATAVAEAAVEKADEIKGETQ